MEALADSEIEARLAALRSGTPTAERKPAERQWVKPLTDAADGLIESLCIDEGIGLGLVEIDVLTRGFRPTDFVIVTGFAHSGKTQLINTMVLNNEDKPVLFFSLDDPAEMILAKLVAMYTGIPSEELERRVRDGDAEAKAIIREAAQYTFRNLLVVDDVLGINAMQDAVRQAVEVWGTPPAAVIIDYLEMMPGTGVSDDDDGANIKRKANDLKKWAKHAPFPVICLHQGTRSNAKPGDPITIMSMGHSGEQQATIVIGCRRQRDRADLEAWDRINHENTITVHVVKNKRPGGRLTHFDGIDFTMEPETGMIRSLSSSETTRLGLDANSATARASEQGAFGLDDKRHQAVGA